MSFASYRASLPARARVLVIESLNACDQTVGSIAEVVGVSVPTVHHAVDLAAADLLRPGAEGAPLSDSQVTALVVAFAAREGRS
jgi:hypothetical protein